MTDPHVKVMASFRVAIPTHKSGKRRSVDFKVDMAGTEMAVSATNCDGVKESVQVVYNK